MAEMNDQRQNISVEWRCQDSDIEMREVGNDFACMVNVPFKIVDIQPDHLMVI